jgi:hypothetical protein
MANFLFAITCLTLTHPAQKAVPEQFLYVTDLPQPMLEWRPIRKAAATDERFIRGLAEARGLRVVEVRADLVILDARRYSMAARAAQALQETSTAMVNGGVQLEAWAEVSRRLFPDSTLPIRVPESRVMPTGLVAVSIGLLWSFRGESGTAEMVTTTPLPVKDRESLISQPLAKLNQRYQPGSLFPGRPIFVANNWGEHYDEPSTPLVATAMKTLALSDKKRLEDMRSQSEALVDRLLTRYQMQDAQLYLRDGSNGDLPASLTQWTSTASRESFSALGEGSLPPSQKFFDKARVAIVLPVIVVRAAIIQPGGEPVIAMAVR